jgi:uncharacterized protein YegL
MALIDEAEAIPRKTMVLFFLIDTSGSMNGRKLGSVNEAIREVIPEIKEVSETNADAQIKIAALEFSSGARWLTGNGPVEAEKFLWNDVDAAGPTDLGEACRKLNEKLSTKAFMKEAAGSFAPAVFLMSDGEPTDDFAGGLAVLRENNWFRAAIKVAIAIGDDANRDNLELFTGTAEAVLEVHSAAMLKKMIKFVSVRASQVASRSSKINDAVGGGPVEGVESGAKQQELNTDIKTMAEEAAADLSSPDGREW